MGKYFNNVRTLTELKKLYKELARKNHPDFGGSVEIMQRINSEYDEMIKWFAIHGDKTEREKASAEVPEKFRDTIEKLLKMPYIQVEIIGGWIWLSGNVGLYLRKIKSLGFVYSTKQKRYYLSDGLTTKCRASKYSMNRIREIYGSTIVENNTTLKFLN